MIGDSEMSKYNIGAWVKSKTHGVGQILAETSDKKCIACFKKDGLHYVDENNDEIVRLKYNTANGVAEEMLSVSSFDDLFT